MGHTLRYQKIDWDKQYYNEYMEHCRTLMNAVFERRARTLEKSRLPLPWDPSRGSPLAVDPLHIKNQGILYKNLKCLQILQFLDIALYCFFLYVMFKRVDLCKRNHIQMLRTLFLDTSWYIWQKYVFCSVSSLQYHSNCIQNILLINTIEENI